MKMYGIKNCDTIKKACKWLDSNGIAFEFHDYKKEPPTTDMVNSWLKEIDIEILINKRGTTYRKLSEGQKLAASDSTKVVDIILQNPSIIKRPILQTRNKYIVGFKEEEYKELIK